MIEYLVLECPHCEARRAVPVVEVDSEETVRAVAKHLLSAHPEIGPAGSNPDIDRAIEDATTVESNQRLGQRGWTTDSLPSDGDGEGPGGTKN